MDFDSKLRMPVASLNFVDPSSGHRAELARIGYSLGYHCEVYSDLSDVAEHPPSSGIIVARETTTEGGATQILERLIQIGVWLPLVVFDDDPTPTKVVAAVKSGALDYLSLPIEPSRFQRALRRIAKEADTYGDVKRSMVEARQRLSSLSQREFQVLEHLSFGGSNKDIAKSLGISHRTVEIHRANMLAKLRAKHAAEAVRIMMEAQR